eukprot:TRINITY_DN5550_c0_g1_i2.p1 TRINITY_DN5550_c0_g1~~TRINITY_DN5550_c0_g1_i2.p1  ORF type:complete len:220 (-),score=17.61 TRINITY_DN5550_c0_g1_i2:329-988(-)
MESQSQIPYSKQAIQLYEQVSEESDRLLDLQVQMQLTQGLLEEYQLQESLYDSQDLDQGGSNKEVEEHEFTEDYGYDDRPYEMERSVTLSNELNSQEASQVFADSYSFMEKEKARAAMQIPVYECNSRSNTNYQGQILKSIYVDNLEGCCQGCQDHPRCNVFVYCPKPYGCHSNGNILPYRRCDLKFQQSVLEGYYPDVWVKGPSTHFTSGFIFHKGLG